MLVPSSSLITWRQARQASRVGFTLLELLLVLTILVAIGAIAAPKLSDVLERQKLNGSATNLRLAWDEARLEAMRTGQAQVFECDVGTGQYTVKPLILQSDITNAGAGATVMTQAGTMVETQENGFFTAPDAAAPSADAQTKNLEEAITFVSCLVSSDMRAYSVAQESQAANNLGVSTNTVVQQVIFYPDGSTSTAEVQIQNERGEIRGIRMRGLTGHSSIVEIKNVASSTDSESEKGTSNGS